MASIKNIVNGSLKSKLIELIRVRGPLSVTEYMRIVLTNPESGFYMNKDVFGVKGHFTTSPEISQVFGEILGAWILQEWKRYDCPKPLQLVEFGPGRGTLMSDIARTLDKFEKSRGSININFIELSPKMKEIQRNTMSLHANLIDRVNWFSHIEEFETKQDGFPCFIAHEFLDALPIYKFVRDPNSNSMRELLVDYDQNENLRFCISRQPSLSVRLLIPPDFKGDHFEVCPDAALQLQKVASKLEKCAKGCMLVCDYGFEDKGGLVSECRSNMMVSDNIRPNRDTFRAFKNHESWPPLKEPGEADLTADVDFSYLKNQLEGKALTFGSVNQREFLSKCGLEARLGVLLDKASESERQELISGAKMLLDDMGDRYRFLAFFPRGSGSLFAGDPPAGFNENE